MDDIPRTIWYRFLEIIPGALSWSCLILPVIASFWYPRAVAVFITLYVLFWFIRCVKSIFFLLYSFFKSRRYEKYDWHTMVNTFENWREVYHVVILAVYKEDKEVLEATMQALVDADYPHEKIIFVLASEERARARGEENAAYIKENFGAKFGAFYHFMHPANVPGESATKGANITHAARKIAGVLKAQGVDFESVIVTTLDADNTVHPLYFLNLTYHYLNEPKREKRIFQPLLLYYKNFWDIPMPNRLVCMANTFWFMAESGESYHLRSTAAYALSLRALVDVDFWSLQSLTEDHHQYWRLYFHNNGDFEVTPIFVTVMQEGPRGRTYIKSLIGQYKQLRRWAMFSSDIPYILIKIWRQRKKLPLIKTLDNIIYSFNCYLMWATAPIIIFFNKQIPTFLNRQFADSLFAYNLGRVLDVTLNSLLFGIAVSIWISLVSLPRPTGRFAMLKFISSLFQWLLLPFFIIIYGAIPALEAQTRLMLNLPLGFEVTEKVRKKII